MSPTGTPGPAPDSAAQPAPAHTAPPARALPGHGESHRHVLVAIVLNKPGVLNRVASLMRARNFNIETLAVSHTDQLEVSRMTITLRGDDVAVEQAAKQLYRLIDVLKVAGCHQRPDGRARDRTDQSPCRRTKSRRGADHRGNVQGPGRGSGSRVAHRRGNRDGGRS